MERRADQIKDYRGHNPFSDSQARNFSDSKVSNEFCPTSMFWSLFNDQHEILIGTRGSGKTFLLKMMRYSMLKNIDDPMAKQLVGEKKYIALYVPMHLEFVTGLASSALEDDQQITLFQFLFNCRLAESLIKELIEITSEESDSLKRAQLAYSMSRQLDQAWFGNSEDKTIVTDFQSLTNKLANLYYSIDLDVCELDKVPPVFKRQICSPLLVVKTAIYSVLSWNEEPTWIICVDEAEFLSEPLQRCINNVFRSDSNRIALKVATLPYYHKTLETLNPQIRVSDGNDFNYCVVDMEFESADFKNLTNKLCSHRMKSRVDPEIAIDTLEDFLGTVGNDDLVDYYRLEMGEEKATREAIESEIILNFSEKRRQGAQNYNNPRKTIYDKFAPIHFVRQMRKRNSEGNRKPGWYAGGATVRKLSQGNPRQFIHIMCNLFEKARNTQLSPKAQHEVLLSYAHSFCKASYGLEEFGPAIYNELHEIAEYLQKKVHDGPLVSVGSSFKLKFRNDAEFEEHRNWIQRAIAFSRLIVTGDEVINGITKDTKYILVNAYAAEYWLPMRADITAKVPFRNEVKNTYCVKKEIVQNTQDQQISLFEGGED